MTKATFEISCDDLCPSFPDQARSVREPLQLVTELPLLCTGWPLPRNTVLLPICLMLENQQYINASMMSAQQWLIMLDKYVKFPADDDLQHVIDGFDNTWGFPNCAGAVDGTHIPIIAPVSSWRLCE